MNAARDLFTDTTRDETPAAEVQVQHRQLTGPTTGEDGRERLDHPPVLAGVCGTCAEFSGRDALGGCTWLPHWSRMSSRATCGFTPVRWKASTAESLARREAQNGIDQAAEAADRHCTGWTERAFEFVKEFAEQMRGRGPYIGHDIVKASLQTDLPQPINSKAWGRPIQRAARARIIRKTERGYAPDPNRHANPVPEWETA